MIFKWTIKNCLLQESDKVLAEKILGQFGIDYEDIEYGSEQINGVPKIKLKWTHSVSPVRVSVYDIKMQIDRNKRTVKFKFRLYKLLVIAVLFSSFIVMVDGNLMAAFLFFIGIILFFGLATLVQLTINLIAITDRLKPKGRIN